MDKKNGPVLGKVIRGDAEWRSRHLSLNPTTAVLHIKEVFLFFSFFFLFFS